MNSVLKSFESFMEDALFKSLPDLTLEPATAPRDGSGLVQARLCFEGSGMKAQAFITCSNDFLQRTCPLPAQAHADGTLRDWLGELGNLILGRLKNRLLAHGITIKISAPSFEGPWQKPKDAQSLTLWFQHSHSLIGFDCAIEGKIAEIGAPIAQSAEILPGDAIYRLNDPVSQKSGYDLISKIRSGVDGEDDEGDLEDGSDFESEEEAEVSPVNRLGDQAEVARWNKAPISPKPVRIHFHNQEPQAADHLTGLAWPQLDRLHLEFATGSSYTLSPRHLMAQGMSSFEVEGLILNFEEEGPLLRISIPKLDIQLSKIFKAA